MVEKPLTALDFKTENMFLTNVGEAGFYVFIAF